MSKEELLNKLEEIQIEYKNQSKNAKSEKDYIYASGLSDATKRIIKLVKEE